jgi:hypothetical protein
MRLARREDGQNLQLGGPCCCREASQLATAQSARREELSQVPWKHLIKGETDSLESEDAATVFTRQIRQDFLLELSTTRLCRWKDRFPSADFRWAGSRRACGVCFQLSREFRHRRLLSVPFLQRRVDCAVLHRLPDIEDLTIQGRRSQPPRQQPG